MEVLDKNCITLQLLLQFEGRVDDAGLTAGQKMALVRGFQLWKQKKVPLLAFVSPQLALYLPTFFSDGPSCCLLFFRAARG